MDLFPNGFVIKCNGAFTVTETDTDKYRTERDTISVGVSVGAVETLMHYIIVPIEIGHTFCFFTENYTCLL